MVLLIVLEIHLLKTKKDFCIKFTNFVLKSNVDVLKAQVDKVDVDKLVTVHVDLSKLSNVVKNEVVENGMIN